MTETITVGQGTELHLIDTDPIVAILGKRPLCGGFPRAKVSGVYTDRPATCARCLAKAAKQGR